VSIVYNYIQLSVAQTWFRQRTHG